MDGSQVMAWVLPLLAVAGLHASLLLRPAPAWAEDLKPSWRRINIWSLMAALLFLAVTGFTYRESTPPILGATLLSGGLLGYLLAQSAFTDPLKRRVDRFSLTPAALLLLGAHGGVLLFLKAEDIFVTYLIFALVAGALIFVPRLIGPSDGRAFLLAVAGAFPVLGLTFFTWALGGVAALLVLYALGASLRQVQAEGHILSRFPKVFFTKVSLPAVPLIIAPFALLLPVAPLL